MRPYLRLCIPLLGILPRACSDSTASQMANLQGAWLVDQTWSGDSLSCTFIAESLFVTQTDTVINGQVRGGTGSCVVDGVPSGQLGQATSPISQGIVKGNAVTFDVTQQLHYEGSVAGGHASGTLTGAVPWGPPANKTIALTGSWTAVRP